MSKTLVAVFDPKGVKHAKTTANASDLVKGAGWTWRPKARVDLTNSAPYRNTERLDPASLAQSVIDNAGANAARAAKLAPVDVPEEEVVGDVDINVFDISDAVITPAEVEDEPEAVEPEVVEDAAPAPAPKAARGRGKKDA